MRKTIFGSQWPEEHRNKVPKEKGGVYLLYKRKGRTTTCIYIGQTENLRRRLRKHAQSWGFDSFSFVILGQVHRELIENFLISAIHPLPGEKMKISLLNENLVPEYPENFRGSKSDYRKYRLKT